MSSAGQSQAIAKDGPFGSYRPSMLQAWMMRFGRRMPDTWAGRRICSLLRSIMRRISSAPIDVVVLGQRMRLYASGNASEKRLLVSPQYFDPVELAHLAKVIKPGFAFVDVGANAGTYTLFVAQHAGPQAKLLAIEPHPVAQARLACNLKLNGIDSGIVAPVAISGEDGELALHLDVANVGSSSARQCHVGNPSGTRLIVSTRTLAGLLAERQFDHIDALKIDIEGAEDLALAPFFSVAPIELHPRLIVIEDNRESWETDLFSVLAEKGYVRLELPSENAIFEKAPTQPR